jgi:choline monooxygenase
MEISKLSIDARLERASTLPNFCYLDAQFFELEMKRVFGTTWQLAGRLDQLQRPGDYFTTTIAQEPVVVTRGADEGIRAFSNVCRHRAGPVAAGCGNRKALQCGYHGWTYSLEGKLLTTPEFDGVEGFERESTTLPQFSVETWAGLIFVNLEQSAPGLLDFLGDLPQRIFHRDLGVRSLAARKEWLVACNWKVYVDNYLEGYHIPIVHPSLNKELDYQNYRVETSRHYSIQHSPIKKRENQRINVGRTSTDSEAQYFWVFPNLMLNIYPDNYSTNLILPVGVDRTLTVFEWFVDRPETELSKAALARTIEFSDEVQVEDIGICETVQKGLRSSIYERGRYSARRENGVHHFHRLLVDYLK